VKDLAGKGEVAKLFAKHFKLAEHVCDPRPTAVIADTNAPP
jgi:hypothetical protein